MNKKEFTKAIQEKLEGFTLKDIEAVVDAISETIADTVKAGDTVKLGEVCKFSAKEVPARTRKYTIGEHIGEEYTIPAHKEAAVKATTTFKKMFM